MRIWLEPPDLVYMAGRGEIVADDMQQVAEFYEKHIRDWPYLLVIGNQTEQRGMSAEARKVAARILHWVPYRGVCLFGGSLLDRTVGKMILVPLNSIWKRDNPIMFVKSDEEARAWIEQRRRELGDENRHR